MVDYLLVIRKNADIHNLCVRNKRKHFCAVSLPL